MVRFNSGTQGSTTVLLLIAGAMAVVFLVVWWFSSRTELPQRGFDRTSTMAPATAAPAPAAEVRSVTPEAMEQFILSRGKSITPLDPFLSSGEEQWKRFLAELRERPPRLDGIVVVEGAKVALIQGTRYREGDDMGPYRVLKIEDRAVQLTKEGRVFTIHLTP